MTESRLYAVEFRPKPINVREPQTAVEHLVLEANSPEQALQRADVWFQTTRAGQEIDIEEGSLKAELFENYVMFKGQLDRITLRK